MTLQANLDAIGDADRQAYAEYRKAAVELAVLDRYDDLRAIAGHDYGGYQRWHGRRELALLSSRLRLCVGELYRAAEVKADDRGSRADMLDRFTIDELAAARASILEPRLNRIERDTLERPTPARRRTRKALELTLRAVDRILEAKRDAIRCEPDRENECGGHYDDDRALEAGAGIGEPYFCDGSCVR
jgi:hypothetical protein